MDIPQIIMGAEVAFFAGISRAEKTDALKVEGTDIMLLEMPFVTWSDSVVQEVRDLIEKRHFHIILAHIERFLQIPGNKPYVRQILELPVTVQVNAETLLDFRQKGKNAQDVQERTGTHHRKRLPMVCITGCRTCGWAARCWRRSWDMNFWRTWTATEQSSLKNIRYTHNQQ